MRNTKLSMILTVATLAALTACGGGSGGGSAATPATPDTSNTTTATIVATVPAPTYTASSEELLALTKLNNERTACGFGLLAQNTQLDAAAKAHADYQLINNVVSHNENATQYPNGYTGVYAIDRATFQGYTGAGRVADEFAMRLSSDPTLKKQNAGTEAVVGLLNAPYHMSGLVSGFRDVGIAVRSSDDTGVANPLVITQFDLAYKSTAGQQLQASDAVLTYPCQGSTAISRQLTNETPNPVPGRDLSTSPLGSSIYVQLRDGNTLTITSATMTNVATSATVTLRAPVTSANDPYAPCAEGCYKTHQAYISADAPLSANTQYQVVLNGTNNGNAFTKTFTFTTGS